MDSEINRGIEAEINSQNIERLHETFLEQHKSDSLQGLRGLTAGEAAEFADKLAGQAYFEKRLSRQLGRAE